jgi:hypothetical protein
MKRVMRNYPILALPYSTQPFVLEYGTSGEGIGSILMKNQHLIAFKSNKFREHVKLYQICACIGQVQIVLGRRMLCG